MMFLIQAQSACQGGGPLLLDMLETFEMMPSSGQVKPGERVNVQVKFVPAAEVDVELIGWWVLFATEAER